MAAGSCLDKKCPCRSFKPRGNAIMQCECKHSIENHQKVSARDIFPDEGRI